MTRCPFCQMLLAPDPDEERFDCGSRILSKNAVARSAACIQITKLRSISEMLLKHCLDPECSVCAAICCPNGEALHFHHDGCPACDPGPITMP